MKESIKQSYDTIVAVVEQFKGTKQEHMILQGHLEAIRQELINSCTCKNVESSVSE
jgi:ribosomal 50S subunit-associated protein YjgA (DUF615 family)